MTKKERNEKIRSALKDIERKARDLREALTFDEKVLAESGKIYKYLPECQIYGGETSKYKPLNIDKNQWLLLRAESNYRGGISWYAMKSGKIYNKKDPTLADFINHYKRN